MFQIIIAYIVAVLLNRAFNWLWWWSRNRRAGPLGYFREYGPMLAATALVHVPIFVLWWSGALLPVTNAIVAGVLKGASLIPGVDLTTVTLPSGVTAASTLIYGWPLDSVASKVGMLLGSQFVVYANGKKEEPKP